MGLEIISDSSKILEAASSIFVLCLVTIYVAIEYR